MKKNRYPANELHLDKDLEQYLYKRIDTFTKKVFVKAFKKLFPNENFDENKATVDFEDVKNYSMRILTVRYKGVIIYRRFPLDMTGCNFRYESIIFNKK